MMHKLLISALLMMSMAAKPVADGGETVLQKMYKQYNGKWFKTFTFNQTTEIYRNDTLRRSETWYEASIFPDRFRIDFGNVDSGNAVIFKGDSSYNFRRGALRTTRKDANDLTFLLGGMYFYPFDKVLAKTKELGYDLSKSYETDWKGKKVYVVGAAGDGEKVNQLWVEKDRLIVVRFIKYENNRKEEGILEDHIKAGNGWTETSVTVYVNDKLVQKEKYHDFKANAPLEERLFEPAEFGKWHWYKK